MILVRGTIENEVELNSPRDWVRDELGRFRGNLLAAQLLLESGRRIRAMSAHAPAWPVDRERLQGIDVSEVKLKDNPDVWVTELMWEALRNQQLDGVPWIVGGDLNSSVTFDTMWPGGPRGNQEIQDRMAALGFVECLRAWQGRLTPTFRHSRGTFVHQIDHLFATAQLAVRLTDCRTGDASTVFDNHLSDHLPIIPDSCEPDCPGDTDGNLTVDVNDLLNVLGAFGDSGPDSPGDADGDGDADINDLLSVLANFGVTCS